jgi:Domain of unknown function (DUF4440)
VHRFSISLLLSLLVSSGPLHFQAARSAEQDRKALLSLEDEWLHARDAATLERILADDFVHPVAQGVFLSKAEHIEWFTKHLPPMSRKTRFDHLQVRLYGDTAVVNGMVIATAESGKELDRSIFTDVFVFRDQRWQAVNAQENKVERRVELRLLRAGDFFKMARARSVGDARRSIVRQICERWHVIIERFSIVKIALCEGRGRFALGRQ